MGFLFVLTGPFSSDHPALKSRWGTLNSRWGMPNLDGGTLALDGGTRPPYNLSTGCTRILLYAKMLKETASEKKHNALLLFLSLVAFRLGMLGFAPPPLATPMTR